MAQQTLTPPEGVGELPAEVRCVHHWIIDPPNERFSRGVCQKCGEERLFRNDFWDSETLFASEAGR